MQTLQGEKMQLLHRWLHMCVEETQPGACIEMILLCNYTPV